MEKTSHSLKYLKQRKFLMILPVLTLPFITFLFWLLGGGKGNDAKAQSNIPAGLNLKLPDAKFKDDKPLDKLSFYQQAAFDSAKAKEAEKLDPYWNKSSIDADGNDSPRQFSDYSMDANKMKVYNKLDELKKAMDQSKEVSRYSQESGDHQYSLKSDSSSNDLARLKAIMQNMNEEKTDDPEITQLNEMLDKITAIQNPGQVQATDKATSGKVLSVKPKQQNADISLLASSSPIAGTNDTIIKETSGNAFYSQADFSDSNDSEYGNSIAATIPETQTIVAGATVKLALNNDVTIKDVLLPSGTFIYGTASLANERLKIEVSSIHFENSILPVSLNVYDMDGQEGIYIPGSINRTVAKESANNAIGGMNMTTVDPSIEAQAASAGIEAAKSLFSKKIRLVKMTVRAGYKVLLKDSQEK